LLSSTDKLQAIAQEIPDSFPITADMTDEKDIKAMIAAAHEHFGRIDVLINNAGQGLYSAVENINIEDYKNVFTLNVVGPLIAMQEVIPLMKAQGGGMIVNISSMVSKNYYPMLGAYASTKYALNCISLTARAELEKDGIVVSVMHPALTETGFGANSIKVMDDAASAAYATMVSTMKADTAEYVAERILHTIQTGEAETLAH
jgi:short-subunit dehydrogenase